MTEAEEISQVADLVLSIMSKDDPEHSASGDLPLSAGKYMPERLLDYKIGEDGKKIFLVKWFGYPNEENTWESETNLSCNYMMQELVEKRRRMIENCQPAYFVHICTHPPNYETGTLSGFDLGHTPELILGAVEKDGNIYFLVKWKGLFEADMIPRSVANVRCPNLVIEYYEERVQWTPVIIGAAGSSGALNNDNNNNPLE